MKANAIEVVQANLYATLKKDIGNRIDSIPDYLLSVSSGKGEYYLKRESTYYYPEAWNKPGLILLKRKVGNFYYVTFGDGTRSIVAYWSFQGNDESMKSGHISPTHGCKYMFGNFWFIPLGAITIAITLFLTKREEKRKKIES
jgi:phosphotransferase system  glucose/maltose/N-acetylglucosamine-specific IIC component